MLGVALAVVALSSATSCAFRQQSASSDDESDIATLNVINHHPLNVTAASHGSFRLHLRRYPGNEVQFFADPIGRTEGVTSDIVHLLPGQSADWTLETDLARSSIAVRN
jgi:hypothetical protein